MLTLLLAVFVTGTAALMAATAAWDRGGGSGLDRALLVALSVAIIMAVHLLPALSRRPAAWLLWFGCLLCAVPRTSRIVLRRPPDLPRVTA